ncbi:transcription elongation factor GreA [Christensenella tenuis]|jgi:transcription elongation factor GreA|uniref:Transcription elongation factor GreA n=1 Tax=Christensenella tenuis TaxID=2763033 RepID=A0ABR7EI14_9FIRM|nr:transcription elongation factor GreA [Christensenella tenuis]MBC5649427.1 transcription elongation factor GreA [Christensenella tenuis]
MANEDVVLTHQGVKELEEKLEYLKTVRRLEVAEEIKTARAFGDLSENAEYDEAKNEQAKIEGEIVMLENMLRNATVVDQEDVDVQRVNVGTTVKVLDKEYDEEIEYKIVGSAEADLSTNKISNESPVGRALLGKKVGNLVKVETPGGIVKLKILDIHR